LNFLELCKAVRRESGITGTGPAQVTSQTGILEKVVIWVQQAYVDVQSAHTDWRFMWKMATSSLQAGKNVYIGGDLAIVDYKKLKSVAISNVEVHIKDWEWYTQRIKRGGMSAHTGVPTHVAVGLDRKLYFYPTPVVASPIEIEYFMKPVALTASTDVPIVPEEFHRAIMHKALMYYADYEDDDFRYGKAAMEFERYLTNMAVDSLPKVSFK